MSATLGDDDNVHPREGREWATTLDPEDAHESHVTAAPEVREPSGSLETTVVPPEELEESLPQISSASLGGSFTDNVQAPGKT